MSEEESLSEEEVKPKKVGQDFPSRFHKALPLPPLMESGQAQEQDRSVGLCLRPESRG
jgi:hypothetical protein